MNATESTMAEPSASRHLLDNYPLIRSRSAVEAREMVGRIFSPHRLDVRGSNKGFEARHNRIALGEVALNVLSYGSEVCINPGERGDFYLVLLPLRGRARVSCANEDADIDCDTLAVLHPHRSTQMVWSSDCAMLMLQVPRSALQSRMPIDRYSGVVAPAPRFAFSQCRSYPAIGAWWRAAYDLATNLHQYGPQWMEQPAACGAMENFLLSGLASMLQPARVGSESNAPLAVQGSSQTRCVRRAMDYLHAHSHEGVCLDDIAKAACVSTRTLEASFQREHQQSPLAYLRAIRLDRMHQALQAAARTHQEVSVTELALQNGFSHMGRFAAYYKQRFGCSPSATLRRA
jgi:AraC-like DNA-binding protein